MKTDEILAYLSQQIALLPELAAQYTDEGKLFTRFSFLQLKKLTLDALRGSDEERFIIIPGLRGVGKTTLLFQIFELIRKLNLVKKQNMLYLSCDNLKNLGFGLNETITVYENKILGEPLEAYKEKVVLFIDEAHYDPAWEIVAKTLYGRSKNILLLVSGSSSIALEASTDTVRRATIKKIYPLNFLEYLILKTGTLPPKDTTRDIREALFNSRSAEEVYEKLLRITLKIRQNLFTKLPSLSNELEKFLSSGGFPFTLNIKSDLEVFRKIFGMLEKIIYIDFQQVHPLSKGSIDKIFPILNIFANANSPVSYRNLSRNLDELSLPSISEILHALRKAGVLSMIEISGSATKAERNSKKHYFSSSTIRATLLWNAGKYDTTSMTLGPLLENAVFNTLEKEEVFSGYVKNITYPDVESQEPDFVATTQSGKIVIECGWGKKDTSQLKKAMRMETALYGLIISDNAERLIKEENIVFVPKDIFLLL